MAFCACFVAMLVRADDPGWAAVQSLWAIEDVELLERAGGLVATRVWLDHQWWRVASAGVLHGSWLHLGLNMMGLWVVGQWTEKVWGPARQLGLFAVASLGGCLASLAWAEAPLVVGASAGIFGVAGALVVARAWGRADVQDALEPVSARVLGFWLVFWLVVGAVLPLVLGFSILAQAGHIGGLVFGCLAGFGLSRPPQARVSRGLAGVGVAMGLAGVALAASAPSWRPNYDLFMGDELLREGAFEDAALHFDRALASSPDDDSLANAVAYSLAEAGVDLDRAEILVRGALEVEPESPHYLDTLGWILCRQGKVEGGLEVLRAAEAASEGDIEEIVEHIDGCALAGG